MKRETKQLLKQMKAMGYTFLEIRDSLSSRGYNLSERSYYRATKGVKRGENLQNLPLLDDFGYIYGGSYSSTVRNPMDSEPTSGENHSTVFQVAEGGCSEKQYDALAEDEAMGAQDNPLLGMTEHIYYPDSSRKSGLLRYLKTEKDDNRKMKDVPDFSSVKCSECGWNVPITESVNGMCEECYTEFRYNAHDSGVQRMPKKKRFDDERES